MRLVIGLDWNCRGRPNVFPGSLGRSDTITNVNAAKAQQFLKEHEDLPAIVKVRTNQPLTQADLTELERILLKEGIGTMQDLMQAKEASQGLGLFIRSLVGLDRAAAKAEFDKFIEGKRPSPNQLRFIFSKAITATCSFDFFLRGF